MLDWRWLIRYLGRSGYAFWWVADWEDFAALFLWVLGLLSVLPRSDFSEAYSGLRSRFFVGFFGVLGWRIGGRERFGFGRFEGLNDFATEYRCFQAPNKGCIFSLMDIVPYFELDCK